MPCQVLGFEDHLEILATPSLKTRMVTLDKFFGHADGDDGLTLEERQELELDAEEMGLTQLKSAPPLRQLPIEPQVQIFRSPSYLTAPELRELSYILQAIIIKRTIPKRKAGRSQKVIMAMDTSVMA
ncbi:hypothetical protein BY996DRAFT_6501028 [Phakopsora pachyrhizi]|nr:hypothetical protein BY996DRAFT_6501028 [Phakopsora pachyrhizi]